MYIFSGFSVQTLQSCATFAAAANVVVVRESGARPLAQRIPFGLLWLEFVLDADVRPRACLASYSKTHAKSHTVV